MTFPIFINDVDETATIWAILCVIEKDDSGIKSLVPDANVERVANRNTVLPGIGETAGREKNRACRED